ncbi:MAG: hypothetical protein Q8K99_13325 [Actinomycetota bacterium]|nr:hypothetical protein [Actinomycetota bacterium]
MGLDPGGALSSVEYLFSGWILWPFAAPYVMGFNAVVAAPAWLWRANRRREIIASYVTWGATVAWLAGATIVGQLTTYRDPSDWSSEQAMHRAGHYALLGGALNFVLLFAIPQCLAFLVATRWKRTYRPVLAAAFSLAGILILMVLGMVTGATPD